jgi:hypothetical protein
MVGGAAYYAGKRRQDTQYREQEQEARLQDLEAQQTQPQSAPPPAAYPAPAPAAAAPGGITPEAMAQLKQLAELKDSGVLTEEEFEVQKRRLLGTA